MSRATVGVCSFFLCNSSGNLEKGTAPGSISHFKGKLDDEGNLSRLFYHWRCSPSTLRTLDKIRNELRSLKLLHIRDSSTSCTLKAEFPTIHRAGELFTLFYSCCKSRDIWKVTLNLEANREKSPKQHLQHKGTNTFHFSRNCQFLLGVKLWYITNTINYAGALILQLSVSM